jgi:AcrR family transcriptional regulator
MTDTAVTRSGGRPRSEEADQAILDAALELLVQVGYQGITVEGIAQRAGVGKATVYRRYANKAEIMVEAIRSHGCATFALVDTGDVRADLLRFWRALAESFVGADGPIMTAVSAEKARHPELRAEMERVFLTERRAFVRQLITDAVARGDLPASTDVELLANIGPAVLWQQLTLESSPEKILELPERLADQFLPPA